MSRKEKKKYKKQVFFLKNTRFILILWYENYHISFVATATHEIFIFKPLYEMNPVCIEKN
jgi:hypothetical protein